MRRLAERQEGHIVVGYEEILPDLSPDTEWKIVASDYGEVSETIIGYFRDGWHLFAAVPGFLNEHDLYIRVVLYRERLPDTTNEGRDDDADNS